MYKKKKEFEYVVNQIPDVRQYQIELTGVASAFSENINLREWVHVMMTDEVGKQ